MAWERSLSTTRFNSPSAKRTCKAELGLCAPDTRMSIAARPLVGCLAGRLIVVRLGRVHRLPFCKSAGLDRDNLSRLGREEGAQVVGKTICPSTVTDG